MASSLWQLGNQQYFVAHRNVRSLSADLGRRFDPLRTWEPLSFSPGFSPVLAML